MIIFIYGPDSYRSKRKLYEILEKEKKSQKGGVRLCYLDDQKLTLDNLREATSSISMFGEKNIAVLSGIFSNKEFKEDFLKSIKDFERSGSLIVIYENCEVDKRDALLKVLLKNSDCQEFKELSRAELLVWLKKECAAQGQKIEQEAASRLVFYVGGNLWLLDNEIKKLAAFCRGRAIAAPDVDLLVRAKIENDIFKTIDAIAAKNKKVALGLLHNHLQQGDAPLYLLSMICFQFRNILGIRDLMEKKNSYGDIVRKSGLHPFVVKKSYLQAQKFNFRQLKKIYRDILSADFSIKTGKIEPETALDLLLAEI